MPELPEVETVARGLHERIAGHTIERVEVFREKVVPLGDTDAFAASVEKHRVLSVARRAKYLIFQLEPELVMLGHLRMTGKFVVTAPVPEPAKHDRAWFWLSNGQLLIFTDLRCFGTLELFPSVADIPKLRQLGPEPLSEHFNAAYLQPLLQKTPRAIKPLLLDQRLVAGLGNIYASEILFAAGIHPERRANTLQKQETEQMIAQTKRILGLAIDKNGTSVSDFRQVDEKTGEFQNFLQVYDKAEQPCVRCQTPLQRIVQAQRSTYFCMSCQS
jgi:formamidopyrimidine-DNA glycosylase